MIGKILYNLIFEFLRKLDKFHCFIRGYYTYFIVLKSITAHTTFV